MLSRKKKRRKAYRVPRCTLRRLCVLIIYRKLLHRAFSACSVNIHGHVFFANARHFSLGWENNSQRDSVTLNRAWSLAGFTFQRRFCNVKTFNQTHLLGANVSFLKHLSTRLSSQLRVPLKSCIFLSLTQSTPDHEAPRLINNVRYNNRCSRLGTATNKRTSNEAHMLRERVIVTRLTHFLRHKCLTRWVSDH